MAPPRALPSSLRDRVFTRSEALAAGITDTQLRGTRIIRVMPGLFRYSTTEPSLDAMVRGIRPLLPDGVALSHTTALGWFGLELTPMFPLHFSTNRPCRVRRSEVRVHRFQGEVTAHLMRGIPILGAERTFVDCGTVLSAPRLLAAGDWLCARGATDPDTLQAFVAQSHLDGVLRARAVARWVRIGAESPRESMTRWHLVARGMPEPAINLEICDDQGAFIGRGDLPYPQFKVLVEYDGWYHERDSAQRDKDILRREALEAAGWVVVIITSADSGERIAWRVFHALRSRGYRGDPPHRPRFGRSWGTNVRQR